MELFERRLEYLFLYLTPDRLNTVGGSHRLSGQNTCKLVGKLPRPLDRGIHHELPIYPDLVPFACTASTGSHRSHHNPLYPLTRQLESTNMEQPDLCSTFM
jgi:hypothetical protein